MRMIAALLLALLLGLPLMVQAQVGGQRGFPFLQLPGNAGVGTHYITLSTDTGTFLKRKSKG